LALTIETEKVEGITVVRCRGSIVWGEQTSEFHLYMKELLTESPTIVLNLEGVPFLDSSGMGMLIGVYVTAVSGGGTLKLVALSRKVQRALTISRLLALFEIYKDEASAIASCKSRASSAGD
jgi:anti-anti-sigma factor